MICLRNLSYCLVFCLTTFWGIGGLAAQEVSEEEVARGDSQDDSRVISMRKSMENVGEQRGEQDAPQGWVLFERALDALVNANDSEALDSLEELAATYPEHRATAVSAEALATLQAREQRGQKIYRKTGLNGEEKSGAARAEFVAFQTAHGIALGGELCGALECEDIRLTVAMLSVGGGAGLGLSLLASKDGVTPGFATLINSGTLWGAYHGAMLSAATDSDANLSGVLAISQLAGIGAGALIWNQSRPTVGEVSMANSGGIWFGTLAFFGNLAASPDDSTEAVFWSILGFTDVGIIAGALLSQYEPMTRGRTLVIDSGGALGMLVGMGTYAIINPEFESLTGFALSSMAGTIAGLGTATYLTRDWDAPDEEGLTASWGIAPTEEGAMLSVSGAF